MSVCNCGLFEIPLGMAMCNDAQNHVTHGVTACVSAGTDWERRAEAAEAAIQRVRDALDRYVVTPYSECSQTDALAAIRDALDGSMASAAGVTPRGPAPRFAPSTVMAMRDPYLDALEQLDQMRDRAFKAEATIRRLEAEVVNLSEELVLAKATIQRVRELHAPIRVDLAGSERCGYCAIAPWPCD